MKKILASALALCLLPSCSKTLDLMCYTLQQESQVVSSREITSTVDPMSTITHRKYIPPWGEAMNVDGSITTRRFQVLGPQQGYLEITQVTLVLLTSSYGERGLFGNLPALKNGVVFRLTEAGVITYEIILRNNEDLLTFFRPCILDTPEPGEPGGVVSAFLLDPGVIVLGEGDRIELVIRDDLRALLSFSFFAEGK